MCGLAEASLAATVISTGMQVKGQLDAGKAAKDQAAYQAAVLRNNQTLAQRASDDAIARGKVAANEHAIKVKALQGRQRAVLAGNGVDVNDGSAVDLIADTAATGKLDELRIRDNAAREALGFQAQGMNFSADAGLAIVKGQNASQAAGTAAFGSGLSGFGTVADRWYTYKKAGAI